MRLAVCELIDEGHELPWMAWISFFSLFLFHNSQLTSNANANLCMQAAFQ